MNRHIADTRDRLRVVKVDQSRVYRSNAFLLLEDDLDLAPIQPQFAAELAAAMLASVLGPVGARPQARIRAFFDAERSFGQSSAIMHNVYPTANRT
jgi:hypothetical protein